MHAKPRKKPPAKPIKRRGAILPAELTQYADDLHSLSQQYRQVARELELAARPDFAVDGIGMPIRSIETLRVFLGKLRIELIRR